MQKRKREKKQVAKGGILFSWRRTSSRCLAFQVGVASSWGRGIRCNGDIINRASQLTRLRWSERTGKNASHNCDRCRRSHYYYRHYPLATTSPNGCRPSGRESRKCVGVNQRTQLHLRNICMHNDLTIFDEFDTRRYITFQNRRYANF